MRYFLDTEFNGFGGPLISLALVSEKGASLYLVYQLPDATDRFVREYVQPKLTAVPPRVAVRRVGQAEGAYAIEAFLRGDPEPEIIADWPDDVRCCCQALMIEPGVMADIRRLRFEIRRVDSGAVELMGAVAHNAWWDAMKLRQRLRQSAVL